MILLPIVSTSCGFEFFKQDDEQAEDRDPTDDKLTITVNGPELLDQQDQTTRLEVSIESDSQVDWSKLVWNLSEVPRNVSVLTGQDYLELTYSTSVEFDNAFTVSAKYKNNATDTATITLLPFGQEVDDDFLDIDYDSIPGEVILLGLKEGASIPQDINVLIIPKEVTIIADNAFSFEFYWDTNSWIENLVFEEDSQLKTIGNQAFYWCENFVNNLQLPQSLVSIGQSAFSNCGFTGNLQLDDNIASIGNSAFSGCNELDGYLSLPANLLTINSGAFWNCSKLTGTLLIPSNTTAIGNNAFNTCSSFTSLELAEGLNSIGDSAFSSCESFECNLSFPSTLETIGQYAFAYCSKLSGNLNLLDTIISIGEYAFRSCSGFDGSLKIPVNTKYTFVARGTFYGC